GKVALVIGASRGLGAAIARAVALQGCTVLGCYARSSAEAEALRAGPPQIPGRIVPVQGDAGDPEWCEALKRKITDSYGRLDFLICSAAPAPRPLTVDPATMTRIREYVDRSLSLVGTPLAAFVDLLAQNAGWGVIISSVYVRTTPAEWPHYV